MAPIAFLSSFTGGTQLVKAFSSTPSYSPTSRRKLSHRNAQHRPIKAQLPDDSHHASRACSKPHRIIGIVGKSQSKVKTDTLVDSEQRGGLFGMKASAYWDSMGVLPLFFASFGIVALAIKMLKVKGGELRSGPSGINKVTIPKTAITSEAEEAELHVFKCGGCGYEMYPARGREFKFFPDSFKCPLCGTPKKEFWDLNDPDDPRNQEDDDEGEEDHDEEQVNDSESNGPTLTSPENKPKGDDETEATMKDRVDNDSST